MKSCLDDFIGIMAFTHDNRCHSIGMPLFFLGAVCQPPCINGTTNAFGKAVVTMGDLIKTFFKQHIN